MRRLPLVCALTLVATLLLAVLSDGAAARRRERARRPASRRSSLRRPPARRRLARSAQTSRRPAKKSALPPTFTPRLVIRPTKSSRPFGEPAPSDSGPPAAPAPTEVRGLLPAPDEFQPLFAWSGRDRFASGPGELEEVFGADTPFQRARNVNAAARREWKSRSAVLRITITSYGATRDALSAFVEPQADTPGAVTREYEGGGKAFFLPPEQGDHVLLWSGNFVADIALTPAPGESTRNEPWEAVRDALLKSLAAKIPGTLAAVALFVFGQEIPLPASPLQTNESLLLPMKPVFDYLGYELTWNTRATEVTADNGKRQIKLKMRSRTVTVREGANVDKTFEVEIAPFTFNDTTYASLDFFAKTLGVRAVWDAPQRRIMLEVATKE